VKLIKITDQIYQVETETQYELAMMFIRIQEYYESPFEEIRGRTFTLEDYMDRYAKEEGNFTYTVDWNGFNVPGNIVRKFFNPQMYETSFWCDYSKKEIALKAALVKEDLLSSDKKFYLLGTHKEEERILDHELAHALWYLIPDYQKAQTENIFKIPVNEGLDIEKSLLKEGYASEVVLDETQAYLATSTLKELAEDFDLPWPDVPIENREAIQKTYYDERKKQNL